MTHALPRSPLAYRGALLLFGTLLLPGVAAAQVSIEQAATALELREVGPAVAGGRIADVEVHPHDKSIWYVGVGGGAQGKRTGVEPSVRREQAGGFHESTRST